MKKPHPDNTVRDARAMHANGYGYRVIGKALGVSPWAVRDWVKNKYRKEDNTCAQQTNT